MCILLITYVHVFVLLLICLIFSQKFLIYANSLFEAIGHVSEISDYRDMPESKRQKFLRGYIINIVSILNILKNGTSYH